MKSHHQLHEDVPYPNLEGGPGEREALLEISREELESQLEERNQELAKTLSLLKATLEATKDGIIALDASGNL